MRGSTIHSFQESSCLIALVVARHSQVQNPHNEIRIPPRKGDFGGFFAHWRKKTHAIHLSTCQNLRFESLHTVDVGGENMQKVINPADSFLQSFIQRTKAIILQ